MGEAPGANTVPSELKVTCEGFEVTGTVYVPSFQRTSDFINNQRHSFVVSNATVSGTDRFGTQFPEILLIRDQILFFHLPQNNSRGGAPGEFPARIRHRVRCIVGDWTVEGDLHLSDLADMHGFFNVSRSAFIPLTDVVLDGPLGHNEASALLMSQLKLIAVASA